MAPDGGGRPAWRFSVEARLAGRLFAGIRLDVAARVEELAGTEMLLLPNTLAFAARATHSLPIRIESPPASWAQLYPDIASGLTRAAPEFVSALATLQAFWTAALTAEHETDPTE